MNGTMVAGTREGLKGEEIPLRDGSPRSPTTSTPLRRSACTNRRFDFDHAKELMLKERGKHFDPDLLDIFSIPWSTSRASMINFPIPAGCHHLPAPCDHSRPGEA